MFHSASPPQTIGRLAFARAAFVALALVAAAPAAAQQQVRPARPAAITTPLRDDDLAWIAPLMAIQGSDLRRTSTQQGAAAAALATHASEAAREAHSTAIRLGTRHALETLRGYSSHAVAPPGARYDAACSGFLTSRYGGWKTVAAFRVADVTAAVAFYRGQGWEVLGNRSSNKVLRAPDGSIRGSLSAPTARNVNEVVAENERQGIDLSELASHCPQLLDGHGLQLELDGSLESEVEGRRAADAASGVDPLRLPSALRQAGLTLAQWDAVWEVIVQAESDEMLAAQPGALERDSGSAEEAARRQANLAWFRRNRAAIQAATRAAMNAG